MSVDVPPQSTACSSKSSVAVASRKVVSITPARVQPIPFCSSQRCSLGVASGVLVNRNQPGRTTSSDKFRAYHRSQTFRGDHDNIDVFTRDNGAVINCKPMCEK